LPQDAVLLIGLVASIYLYDSTLLLHTNEGVLTPTRAGRWSVSLGTHDYRLLGKHLFIPNPLFPHRPLFRLAWSFEGETSAAPENWDERSEALRPIVPMIWIMALALFVLLPLGFFTTLGDLALIAAIALLYLSIVAALIWIWHRRSEFNLAGKQFVALAFETLVCSPLALNLVRRLSAQIPAREDLVSASRRLQTTEDWHATRAMLVARLDEAIDFEEEGSQRMAHLREYRRSIAES
jgi:hypothetical protein